MWQALFFKTRYNCQYWSAAESEMTATIPRSAISNKQVILEYTQVTDMFTMAHFKDDFLRQGGVFWVFSVQHVITSR